MKSFTPTVIKRAQQIKGRPPLDRNSPFWKAVDKMEKARSLMKKPLEHNAGKEIIYKDGTSEFDIRTKDVYADKHKKKGYKVYGPV